MDQRSPANFRDPFSPPRPRVYSRTGSITMTATVALVTVAFLIFYVYHYIRWQLHALSLRRRQEQVSAAAAAAVQTAPGGLKPEAVKSLPTLVFSAASVGGGYEEGTDCVVCLTDFEEGEKMRSLPQCGHRFHVGCIDMWLYSHATCPLCRSGVDEQDKAGVVEQTDVAEAAAADHSSCRSEDGTGCSVSASSI